MSPNKTEIAEECIDPLVRGLALPDARARAEAATSLGLLGHLAQRAAPALEENRRDPDESVRKAVAEALERIRHGTAAR
jgi:HEAT repeat protein